MVEKIEERIVALEERVAELGKRTELYPGEYAPMIQILLQQAVFLRGLVHDIQKSNAD